MSNDLIYGRILTEQETLLVTGGICITTSTVSEGGNGTVTDDSSSSGPSCPPETEPSV